MNSSRNIEQRRVPAFLAMLFGAIFMMLLPAYGQQEMDPTWYDPWGAPNAVTVQASHPQVATAKHHAKVKGVSSLRVAGKSQVKKSATRAHSS